MNIIVAIASSQRPAVLHETVLGLGQQSDLAQEVLISVASSEDVLAETLALPGVHMVKGPRGLTCQRNTAVDNLAAGADLIVFLDDDVELHRDYLKSCAHYMQTLPDLAVLSGRAIADGSLTGEISRADARAMLARHSFPKAVSGSHSIVGFNMAVTAGVARRVRFDERLALYALFEDRDFSARCRLLGRVLSLDGFTLVHLAARTGRISSTQMGFAQIMNLYYLWRKGTMQSKQALRLAMNCVGANLLGLMMIYKKCSRGERWRRLLGNTVACRDVLRFGAQPERVRFIE